MSAAHRAIRGGRLVALACAMFALGCGTRTVRTTRPQPVPVAAEARLGDCVDPGTHGVIGAQPLLVRADRDLDGDDVNEAVIADRGLCTPEGNCHWNLYRTEGDCYRYLGTVSGANIQRLSPRGAEGFVGLRGWWKLTGNGRMLLQEYRFRRGGYRLVEALLCRQSDDDRMVCEEQGR